MVNDDDQFLKSTFQMNIRAVYVKDADEKSIKIPSLYLLNLEYIYFF